MKPKILCLFFLLLTSFKPTSTQKRRPVVSTDGALRNVIDFIFYFPLIFKGYSHFPNNIAPTGATGPTGPTGATGATGAVY